MEDKFSDGIKEIFENAKKFKSHEEKKAYYEGALSGMKSFSKMFEDIFSPFMNNVTEPDNNIENFQKEITESFYTEIINKLKTKNGS
jgi:hypothetical protein